MTSLFPTRLRLGLLALFLLALPSAARATPVAVELCLAVDGSGSIAEDEFRFQREAYAAALTDARVLRAFAGGPGIAVALMEWGGAESMHPIVDWQHLRTEEDAAGFAAELLAAPRRAQGWNSISNAIEFCRGWMAENAFVGARRVIDVSGDAGQRGGLPLPFAREQAVADGVTINALALSFRGGGMTGPGGGPLLEHYRRDVIGGSGAFALEVTRPEDFVESLVRKLVLELASL